ncbi:hypothetical protein HWV62_36486 [Athelia sp. TMB]|nr:hypothetical protein HWV62_36486 [Athelia sp. TMB]
MFTSNDKRTTRSQLTLPALDPSALGRSPLKDARLALRNTSNSQLLAKSLAPLSESSAVIMGGDASDGDDEILLSPKKQTADPDQVTSKNKKRHSDEEPSQTTAERESKRAKMQALPPSTAEEGDIIGVMAPVDIPMGSNVKPPPETPQRQLEANTIARAPPIPHIDLKNIAASPWKTSSPAKLFQKLLVPQTPRASNTDLSSSSKFPLPVTPRTSAPIINVQPETPEGQILGPANDKHGMVGPMSPLTPLPPTPAIFGNTIRAFTAGKKGPGVLERLGAVQANVPALLYSQERPEPQRSKLSIATGAASKSHSLSFGPSSAPHPPDPPTFTLQSDLPTSSAAASSSTSAVSVTHKPSSRTRGIAVVPDGAGSYGPKPKTPSVLKVKSMRGTAPAGVRGAGRVTRSVSQKLANEDDGKDDKAHVDDKTHKAFSFTFKAPGLPASAMSADAKGKGKATTLTKHGPQNANSKSMKQMSMKDFMAGASSKPKPSASTSTSNASSSLSNPKSHPVSPNKPISLPAPRPAWNASAGSPTKPRSSSVKPASSLSTLSIALEKLAMPRPMRPNTSLGFSSGGNGKGQGEADDDTAKDDGAVGMRREGLAALGLGVPPGPKMLKRSATVGDMSRDRQEIMSPSKAAAPTQVISTAKASAAPGSPMKGMESHDSPSKKRPSSMFALPIGPPSVRPPAKAAESSTKPVSRTFGVRVGLFGSGSGPTRNGLVKKASKKTSLPSVMASPVKGGGTMVESDLDQGELTDSNPMAENDGDVSMRSAGDLSVVMKDVENEDEHIRAQEKERERPRDAWKLNASTRASMASHSLTQSLSNIPRTPPKGLMGPPRTPTRAASATYPSSSSASRDQQQDQRQAELAAGSSKTAPSALGRVRRGEDGHVGASRSARIHAQERDAVAGSGGSEGKTVTPGALSVLKDCVIFVDVRTDGGDDAGGLFVDMLKGMGARILTRVGPTCTHIVYKNGLMSTLTRYRMLKENKPMVVGINWVVECVERRTRIDETPFTVDLTGVNVAGTNKRRRSMLPKFVTQEAGLGSSEIHEAESSHIDASGDVSDADSSMQSVDNGDLPPLEKARRRRLLSKGRA